MFAVYMCYWNSIPLACAWHHVRPSKIAHVSRPKDQPRDRLSLSNGQLSAVLAQHHRELPRPRCDKVQGATGSLSQTVATDLHHLCPTLEELIRKLEVQDDILSQILIKRHALFFHELSGSCRDACSPCLGKLWQLHTAYPA